MPRETVPFCPEPPQYPKSAPPGFTREWIGSSPSRARRFLAWCAIIEIGGVSTAFNPEDDFVDAMHREAGEGQGVRVWDDESAARLNACMEQAFLVLGAGRADGVFEALHAIYLACGYEGKDGEATK